MAYRVAGYPDLETARPQGGPGDLAAGRVDVRDVSPGLLAGLERVAQQLHARLTIFSGYRTNAYSAQVGGFAGDPHTQGRAVDVNVGGTPIGLVPRAMRLLAGAGLTSGNTPGFYKGAPDPAHVQVGPPSSPRSSPVRPRSPGVPAPLWSAIQNAASRYGVPADILAGIWRIESGSTFPNPAVNSLGYGGLFGTTDWNGSTQSQANTAASILSRLLRQHNGDMGAALLAYSGGAYSTVPGTGSGSGSSSSSPPPARSRPGGEPADPAAAAASAQDAAWSSFFDPVPELAFWNPLNLFKGAGAAVNDVGTFLHWIAWIFNPRNLLRMVEFLAGFGLLMLGLVIAVRAFDRSRGTTVSRGMGEARGLARGFGLGRLYAEHQAGERKRKSSDRAAGRRSRTSAGRQQNADEFGEVPF